jgi:hypothetical protein
MISAHPGCTAEHTEALLSKLGTLDLQVKQFQDFTPTPGTLSTAMFVTGLHRDTDEPIQVARKKLERKEQRGLLERQRCLSDQQRPQKSMSKQPSRKMTGKK